MFSPLIWEAFHLQFQLTGYTYPIPVTWNPRTKRLTFHKFLSLRYIPCCFSIVSGFLFGVGSSIGLLGHELLATTRLFNTSQIFFAVCIGVVGGFSAISMYTVIQNGYELVAVFNQTIEMNNLQNKSEIIPTYKKYQ
jgi:hypothetical protein